MRRALVLLGIVFFVVPLSAQRRTDAAVEVRLEQSAEHTPAIGVNDFGDSGGIRYSAGNLIPGGGFEPITIRRYWRVIETGRDRGYWWIRVDGGGMTDWDLVTTGFLNGASYRLYRIVDDEGQTLPVRSDYLDLRSADRFIRVGAGNVPEAGARNLPLGGFVDEPGEQRIYLDGPAPELWDYIFFQKQTIDPDPDWSHPRLDGNGHSDTVEEVWRPGWGLEDAEIELLRRPHGSEPPTQMRFPGETSYHVISREVGRQAIHGPYVFFPVNENPEGNWYGTLEPGQTYRYEAWMRQEGLRDGGRVELGFFMLYEGISETFTVGDEWTLVGFEFTAPERPTTNSWHAGPAIRFTGPGTLEVDNIRLFAVAPGQETELFAPSPLVFDELMASQPGNGEKGILRSMYVMMNNASMESLLSPHRDAEIVYDWYIKVGTGETMTLPGLLDYARRTGGSPQERMKPWLNISTLASEQEWEMLMEYLAAPIDPEDPADVRRKPWAYLRYRQRGVATPWTEEFEKIIVEFANETWHNGAVEDQWRGWHRYHWVHQGSQEFGLWAQFMGRHLRERSPWFSAARDSGKLELVMGSNYQDYAEAALPLTSEVSAVGHTTYVGPRWEQGEKQILTYNQDGLQATLFGYVGGLDDEFDRYRMVREEHAAAGRPYQLYAYEGGPSGYSLPGTAEADQVEIAERYGKSQAMAVATLDAWLGAYQMGFSEMAFLGFGQGDYWNSHTPVRMGFRRHAPWLALMMANRYATGDMITAEVTATPTMRWAAGELPLLGSYAFRDGSQIALVLLNRGLEDEIDVALTLPADARGPAVLYALDGDPAATNRFAQDVQIERSEHLLRRESTVTVPPGSIHLYVVNTVLPTGTQPPGRPASPAVALQRGSATVSWEPVADAQWYVVLRGREPFFRAADAQAVFAVSQTQLNDDGVRAGESYYYRVAAVNQWGRGMPSLVAAGGRMPR